MTVEYNCALIYNAFGLPEATLGLQSEPLAPLALDHVRVNGTGRVTHSYPHMQMKLTAH